jgi:hypothetical protein
MSPYLTDYYMRPYISTGVRALKPRLVYAPSSAPGSAGGARESALNLLAYAPLHLY